jgi:hypothetical protein
LQGNIGIENGALLRKGLTAIKPRMTPIVENVEIPVAEVIASTKKRIPFFKSSKRQKGLRLF